MEENENLNNEYEPIDMGSTEYWKNVWEKEKQEQEDEEKRLNQEVDLFFKCKNPKCGYVVRTKEKIKLKDVEEVIRLYENGKCPKCGNKGFKRIDKKEYEKLKVEFANKEKKKKSKEEVDKEKIEREIKKNIADDVNDVLKDLTNRLLDGKMSPKSFVKIFFDLSIDIAHRYYKCLPGGTDSSTYGYYRKNFLSLCDCTLDRYNVQEEAEYILQTYDIQIEENKEYLNELYNAEYNYYINDEKYSILDFDMKNRIDEYENAKNNIFIAEHKKEKEAEYQEKKALFEEKYAKRMANREFIKMRM